MVSYFYVLFIIVLYSKYSFVSLSITEIRQVDRPEVISLFFQHSNSVDRNNHDRQFELALEKKWITQDCYFRLTTTMYGLGVTDSKYLMCLHNLFPLSLRKRYADNGGDARSIPLKTYAGTLSAQLLKRAEIEDEKERMSRKRMHSQLETSVSSVSWSSDTTETFVGQSVDDDSSSDGCKVPTSEVTYVSSLGRKFEKCIVLDKFVDGNGQVHHLAKFPVAVSGKNKKRRTKVQPCNACGKECTMFCVQCNKPFCHSFGSHGHGRRCFDGHIPKRSSTRLSTLL